MTPLSGCFIVIFMSDIYSKNFFSGCLEVLKETGFPEVRLEDSSPVEKIEVVSSVGITGDIYGYFIIQTDKKNAQSFVDILMESMGMEPEAEFGSLTREAIGEITNQISGRSTILLSQNGVDCDITPPTVMTGSNLLSTISNTEVNITKYINGEFGSIGVYVGVKIIRKRQKVS